METLSEKAITDKLKEIRERPANYHFFFSELNSVEWLKPLRGAGYFSSPPQSSKQGDTIISPFWPESRYLARVASKAPEEVFEILINMPATDSVRVHEDFVETATKLPGESAAEWTRKEIRWIKKQEHLWFSLPSMYGKLIAHLAQSGEPDTAINLAKTVLRVKTGEGNTEDAQGLFSAWEYENILSEYFIRAIRQMGKGGLELLIKLLDDAFAVKSRDQQGKYSYIWRPTIKPSAENLRYSGIYDALIDAIRDGSNLLILEDDDLPTVVNVLLACKKPVFKRITLDLLSEYQTHPLAKQQVCDRENFFAQGLGYEYTKLLSVVFPELDEKSKKLILSWIEKGPEENKGDANVTHEELKGHWQLKHLHTLKGNLPAEWKERYAQLISRFGEPDPPPRAISNRFFIPTKSPKEIEDLKKMDIAEIASFLEIWKLTDRHSLESPGRLGNALKEVVAEAPDRFATTLDLFRNIHPTYSRALIDGFKAAVIENRKIAWDPVLNYLKWVVEQPRNEVEKIEGQFDSDPHWGWARNSTIDLLSVGCEKNVVDPKLREPVWDILNVVAEDENPTVEDDEKSEVDPTTQSINTTRGKALHVVVQYALWVRRTLTKDLEKSEIKFDMSSIPKVQKKLEKHLDPEFDPSPAIRAVFGQWYPWLVLLDENWAKDNIDKIFSTENKRLYDAAWDTYLKRTPAYETPFLMLRPQYETAVEKLNKDRISEPYDKPSWVSSGFLEKPSVKLGEHLMVMLSRGVLSWDDKDQLVKRFFKNASANDIKLTIEFVGQSLDDKKESMPDKIVQRFHKFWECMVDGIQEEINDSGELAHPFTQFGWWFISGCFKPEWALKQLQRVVRVAGKVEPELLVIEKLAELAGDYPAQSFTVLEKLVDWDQDGRNIFGWNQNHIEAILRVALTDKTVKADADALIRRLGDNGNVQFFDLLNSK